MLREGGIEEIYDGNYYAPEDLVPVGCRDCEGCSDCCRNTGDTIILDPYDMYLLCAGTGKTFQDMIEKEIEIRLVDGIILPNLMQHHDTDGEALEGRGRPSEEGFARRREKSRETAEEKADKAADGRARETAEEKAGKAADGRARETAEGKAGKAADGRARETVEGKERETPCKTEKIAQDRTESRIQDCCPFLSAAGRCTIHPFRPGLCRLYPMGRYYTEDGFRYILQKNECTDRLKTQVLLRDWLGIEDLPRYEAFVLVWHDFKRELQKAVPALTQRSRDSVLRYVLQIFFVHPYLTGQDFYPQFRVRMETCREALREIL